MAIATLLGLQDRRVRNSHRQTISGSRWSRWRVRAFQHRRHSTSCVLLGQQRSSRSNTIRRSYNTLYKWDSYPAAQPSREFFICQRTADAHFSSETATSPSVYPVHSSTTAALLRHGWLTCWSQAARGEHHYVADSDSLCLEAPSAGQLYLQHFASITPA